MGALGWSAATVRRVLRAYVQRGPEALFPALPGRKPDVPHRQSIEAALQSLLALPRAWTATQLARAIEAHGVHLGPRQVRRYLGRMGAGWRRTQLTLEHKQDTRSVSAARQALFRLKKARGARVRLYFVDECGFSPTQPVGYSWTAAGERRRVRYEATARRRVNALAAYCPLGPWRGLHFRVVPRTLNAADTLHFLQSLIRPGAPPAWVVVDNGNIHRSLHIRRALPNLARHGVHLFFLPPYSPELNDIEPVFGVIKSHEMPERSYSTLDELLAAVRRALRRYHLRVRRR
ncbi:IS630 family transposase [Corallococcus exiguus]|uniref:IS630 family transposase n=1 Tax=Corallococcus exiguus TaxID=83462 RepID=UPI00345A0CD2